MQIDDKKCQHCGDPICDRCKEHAIDCQCDDELYVAKLKRGCACVVDE
tara:strand:+ start:529 stop:672 length:144 start_codon:yes stop_codon:yes gene_type:complete